MKKMKVTAILLALTLLIAGCGNAKTESTTASKKEETVYQNAVAITLNDQGVQVDGEAAGTDAGSAVYVANDIIYYEEGKDFTYGEGTEKEAHSKAEADAHTVVHIGKPGTYVVSGTLSKGQIAVDLGEDAKENPEAVVTLVLKGADITCEVAPAVIFYNVYECGSDDADSATKDVDTAKAGANVIISDGTTNNVTGSYVARIYEPDTVVLNEAKTEVEDAKKLHKYDAAFYSKMSMNINGERENSGVLNIKAENEGLDSELHLTINGGDISIESGNDGINTNEDGVSVTTVNGGSLKIKVSGETGEGDGIDSNGWLVINGGTVIAQACSNSMDAGIDSDMGIHITGGTVMASGNMLDSIEEGGQNYAVFQFSNGQKGGEKVTFKNEAGDAVMEHTPENAYSILIFSSPDLKAGTYTLWNEENQLKGQTGGSMMGGPGMFSGGGRPSMNGENGENPFNGEMPEGMEIPGSGNMPFNGEMPEGMEIPEGGNMPFNGEMPEGMEIPGGGNMPFNGEMPEGMEIPEGGNMPGGQRPSFGNNTEAGQDASAEFTIVDGGNMFIVISDSTNNTI